MKSEALDVVMAPLAARAVSLGKYSKPTRDQQAAAEIEGWICLPVGEIASLI